MKTWMTIGGAMLLVLAAISFTIGQVDDNTTTTTPAPDATGETTDVTPATEAEATAGCGCAGCAAQAAEATAEVAEGCTDCGGECAGCAEGSTAPAEVAGGCEDCGGECGNCGDAATAASGEACDACTSGETVAFAGPLDGNEAWFMAARITDEQAATITEAMPQAEGIREVRVNLETGEVAIARVGDSLTIGALLTELANHNVEATPLPTATRWMSVSGPCCSDCWQRVAAVTGGSLGVRHAGRMSDGTVALAYDPTITTLRNLTQAIAAVGDGNYVSTVLADTVQLQIPGLTDGAGTRIVERAIGMIPDVVASEIDAAQQTVTVQIARGAHCLGTLRDMLATYGYQTEVIGGGSIAMSESAESGACGADCGGDCCAGEATEESTPISRAIRVADMHCGNCAGKVEAAVALLAGVESIVIDMNSHTVTVIGGDAAEIEEAIRGAGFTPEMPTEVRSGTETGNGRPAGECACGGTCDGDCGEAEAEVVALTLHVADMHCGNCAGKVRAAIEALDGVAEVAIDMDTNNVTITGGDRSAIEQAIRDAGFTPSEPSNS